jgi:tRNA (Thr-GGU) A37 N-methylase
MEIKLTPIGVVHTKASDLEVKEKGNVEGELLIYPKFEEPKFEEALEGIDDYSDLFVIVNFDRLRAEQVGPLRVKPRGLVRRI